MGVGDVAQSEVLKDTNQKRNSSKREEENQEIWKLGESPPAAIETSDLSRLRSVCWSQGEGY